ncbi:putative M23-family peptidase [Actinoplanes missouriensis 431]|uniref:Putative M23-family peptidase n=1 Tax=Actinoplanes missouriensis (strain ATCC 14538 / DSM 43046 / CBS 188.64 / JCM 3121 / NBRC 102363 / NCIMB 12654 / NRRL B-3342 / UNCC 431) TaxID=512565 RepID=I0H975_ACTM4|nr:M23 family metallopeptidase [Actinoplanes missouriensis]BAL89562.1 putative M23-family peptidase [Actinoplanes missouriensis 431]
MKRAIARWQTWWLRLFVLLVLALLVVPIPKPFDIAMMAAAFGLFLIRPPQSTRPAVELAPPIRGHWVALNSPGNAVPSHGVKAYGQMYAVDLLQPSADAATSIGWSIRTRAPETYPCFGEPVQAMAAGTVVRAADRQRDHRSRDTWPTLIWMMTVEAFARELAGASRILGNHVIVDQGDGAFAVYAHLRRGSARVRAGERVEAGQQLAEVGNTGNTSEPHLHVQVMDRAEPTAAAGIPMRWTGVIAGEVDPRWSTGEPKPSGMAGFPRNGQVFEASAD